MTASKAEQDFRVFVALQIGTFPVVGDFGSELSVVQSVAMLEELVALLVADLLEDFAVVGCECCFGARFRGDVQWGPRWRGWWERGNLFVLGVVWEKL